MTFHGESRNPRGQAVGRAQFFVDVRAENEESLMLCQELTTYMDQVVRLDRQKPDPAARQVPATAPDQEKPKPQIALIDCRDKVLIINRKTDPETHELLQKQQIDADHVIYEKLTGKFLVPGPGLVRSVQPRRRERSTRATGRARGEPGHNRGPADHPTDSQPGRSTRRQHPTRDRGRRP